MASNRRHLLTGGIGLSPDRAEQFILGGLSPPQIAAVSTKKQSGPMLFHHPGRVGRVGGYIDIMKGVRKLENVRLSWWKWTVKLHLRTAHSCKAWKQGFLPTAEEPKYKYRFIGPIELRHYVKG